eukprot:gnl/MRDRNA2_/MRDRNA2_87964_c0_seq1.p1 gnl/MRDRNA2_/MRDRNA2_87964_c0~~gnl/MRDRNA2_/MRDRNA2_87964_c0_seq1.p1  ORF type:complete len:693 (+),score=192.91 gnl/MRDRNA2_/MRDRNA2_87964_c0_seq1:97-2175(+)
MEGYGGLDAGHDMLMEALGGQQSLDDFVEYRIYFDKVPAGYEAAESFLCARVAALFHLLRNDLDVYHWQRDRFVLEVDVTGNRNADSDGNNEPHLFGHVRTGDGTEDEWYVIYLLRKASSAFKDMSCRIFDADGEVLLIEAALATPSWVTPENAENRCWLRGGDTHILARPKAGESMKLSLPSALESLRAGGRRASEKVQQEIQKRLENYPQRAVTFSRHVCRAVLPEVIARLLIAVPALVSVALDHIPPPTSTELARLRKRSPDKGEKALRFDCERATDKMTIIGVRLTRCQFARISSLRIKLPQRFTQTHWRLPQAEKVDPKAMRLGALLCAGLEAAYLEGSEAATSALRWPATGAMSKSSSLHSYFCPSSPWCESKSFIAAVRAQGAPDPMNSEWSAAIDRAYLQQHDLDANFQLEFMAIHERVGHNAELDLREHFRDVDDDNSWLDVEPQDLDNELRRRQEEFEAYDARQKASPDAEANQDTIDAEVEAIKKELGSLGGNLSEMLQKTSSILGVEKNNQGQNANNTDAKKNDDDDDEGSGDDPFFFDGEEDADSDEGSERDAEATGDIGGHKDMKSYMSALDDELGVLDAEAADDDLGPNPEDGSGAADNGADDPTSGMEMSLGSHHIRTDMAPVELDSHAMAHLLASYCAETDMDPGPTSVMLRELGLQLPGPPAGGARSGCLDDMD